jgi:general secretion pathway protein A
MFLEHYGLTEQPFGVTPDPRFLYLGAQYREALAALDYGTKNNRGFLALIAKPGMGKTSLLFQYLESLRENARTVFLFQTQGDSRDLMRYLLADLGVDGTGKDLPEMHSILNQVLMEEMRAGRRFVLVIDEAQNLDERVLESIRLLSNFETPWAKLMHIVMAGQPELADLLARASMAQLRQRISFYIRIKPFTAEETDAYISHRLRVAGYQGPPLFTVGAQRLIAEHSEGTPRVINNICFSAMSLGWVLKQSQIDEGVVQGILDDLEPKPHPLPPKEQAAVLLKSAQEMEPRGMAAPRLMESAAPRRWLRRVVLAAALLLPLTGGAIHFGRQGTHESYTSAHTLTWAAVLADSLGPAAPGASLGGPREAAASGAEVSSVSPPWAKDSGELTRHGDQVNTQIQRLWLSLARLSGRLRDTAKGTKVQGFK